MNTVDANKRERKILFATLRSELDDTTFRPLKNRDSLYDYRMNTPLHASRKVRPLQAVSAYQEWILIESIYIDTGFLLIS